MDSIKRKLLGEPEPEPTLLDEINQFTSLSLKTRIYGTAISICIGIVLILLAIFLGLPLVALNPAAFAVPYTLANIALLGSTFFLVGPVKQIKNMAQPTRIIATLLYVGSLAFTLWAAFGAKSYLLVIIAVIIQVCAIGWYVLSYIPFARQACKAMCGSFF